MQGEPVEKPFKCSECSRWIEFDDVKHTAGTLVESGLLVTKQLDYVMCVRCYELFVAEELLEERPEIRRLVTEKLAAIPPHEFIKET